VRLSRQFFLNLDARMDLTESTDPRAEYERTQASIGLRYEL
jgi:hypothetical protein